MNILELCLSSGLGGLELYVFRSSEAMAASQLNTNTIIPVLRENSKLDKYYKDHSNFNIHYIQPFFSPLPLLNARKLASIIEKYNIDAIHMHWGKDLPLAALAKIYSKRKPALVYTRQMIITRSKDDFYHNFLYKQLDLMLVITKQLEDRCKNYIPLLANKISTLYYGVKRPKKKLDKINVQHQRENLGFSKNDFIAGLVGRLERGKGQHLLIDALHTAHQNGHNIKALIIGHEMSSGYRDKLKNQASKLGVLDKIIFLDFSNDPQQLMQLCDCVILATDLETFGLVLPEAMRAGVAVIGSNNGGVPEIIDHEKTGLLFQTKDATSLYHQIERLYLDADFKRKLAQQGKFSADQRFDNEIHFQQLEQHFESVITHSI